MPSDLLSFDLGPAAGGDVVARVAAGPGFWTEWLSELSRTGLLEALLSDGTVDRALREAPVGHRYDRVLNAKMTLVCVLVACLFPAEGYDKVLALAFGLPGLRFRLPRGKTPSGSAFSQARKLLGEHVMRRAFEIDAAVSDAELGIAVLWKGLEVTAIDGTTMEVGRDGALAEEFGSSSEAGRPLPRITAHVRTASRRWIGAAVGTYHQGENELADQLEDSFKEGILNIADRGFISMDRFLRFSAKGAHLAWRVKNSASQVPFRTVAVLPDGSELVRMRESDGMRRKRRKETGNPQAERLPDTVARLVAFTVLAETRSGRKRKPARIRVLTTLLDHVACPARDIAELYAERWQIEIAFLHLKQTVRGPRRPLRGKSAALVRQEAWGLLLIHNIVAAAAARAAAEAGISPHLIPFAPVLALIRAHVAADTCCPHCGHRPVSANAQLSALTTAILALPRHREGRKRTSGRTAAERRTTRTENVTYFIDVIPSNLPRIGQEAA
jgi:Transposase DDE domain/Insertion element 4 transposase N-terminal